jgi:hypothetical protein
MYVSLEINKEKKQNENKEGIHLSSKVAALQFGSRNDKKIKPDEKNTGNARI